MSHARELRGRAHQRRHHRRRKSVQEIEIFLRAKLRWWIRRFARFFILNLFEIVFSLVFQREFLLSVHITQERSTATTRAQQQNLHGIRDSFFSYSTSSFICKDAWCLCLGCYETLLRTCEERRKQEKLDIKSFDCFSTLSDFRATREQESVGETDGMSRN